MKPTLLLIMDGWGIAPAGPGNATSLARTPNLDRLTATCPHSQLKASGRAVGLPEGYMGNSEVGHLNIGAGRVVYQDMTRIDMAMEDGTLETNPVFVNVVQETLKAHGRLHFAGLLSDGGVIGGSSAGAAIMSRIMIARGDDEGALTLPLYTDVRAWQDHSEGFSPEPLLISRGLGFLPHGIVDQHFNRRARLQRLMAAMEASNEAQGFGISEDTALEVSLPDGTFRVLGSAYVMHLTRKDGRFTIEKLAAAHSAVQ